MFTSGSGSPGWTVYGKSKVSHAPGARLAENGGLRLPSRLSENETRIKTGVSAEPTLHTSTLYVTVSPTLEREGPVLSTVILGWNSSTTHLDEPKTRLSNPSGW